MTEDEQKQLIISKARQLSLLMSMPGWDVVKTVVLQVKKAAKTERRKAMRLQSTRELILYHTGFEDGAQSLIENLAEMLKDANAIEQADAMLREYEEVES